MRNSTRTAHRTAAAVIFSVLFLIQGCALDFSGDNFQRFRIFFKLTETLAEGETRLVHSWFFPSAIKVRKRWVRISGRLSEPAEGGLPAEVTVVARFEDVDSGKQQARVSIKARIEQDGTFSARKKLKKNISANSLMMVTIEPGGSDLEANTGLALCVDLVESKKDLGTIPDCLESDDNGGDGPEAVTLTQLQTSLFTPTCAVAGCHSAATARAGLVLEAGRSFGETVNVASSQLPEFDIIEPGDPERSYMVKKLRGDDDINGERMPEGGPFLSDEVIAQVFSWINAGALDN
ncbi:MAG: hypothetical protein IH936_13290 [Acidobacteria bacterium]|nr:hypothetical protein [Acidobacteriota bacterium]